MRYPGSEKLEIIRRVEQSHLPVRRTLATLGILPMTFYRWVCAHCETGGPEALEDKPSRPRRVWNKIPGGGPRTDRRTGAGRAGAVAAGGGDALHRYEEILRVRGLGLSAAQGSRPDHQPGFHRRQGGRRVQGQDDGTEPAMADRLHVPEGDRLGLVLSVDHPRRLLSCVSIIAWKLCTTMKAEDVTDTLKLALTASRLRERGAYGLNSDLNAIFDQV